MGLAATKQQQQLDSTWHPQIKKAGDEPAFF
jgi:hypothetical protein